MSFEKEENWGDFPWLFDDEVVWEKLPGPGLFRYKSWVKANDWRIRLNDFPDEPLFTLLVNGQEIIHFNDWPRQWGPEPS